MAILKKIAKTHILPLLAYGLLSLLFTYPLAWRMETHVPMAPSYASGLMLEDGDPWAFIWDLWWVKKALLSHHTSPFFTPYIFHPFGVSLAFHSMSLYSCLISLPLQSFLGLVTTYNVLILSTYVLSGYGMYLLVTHLTGHRLAAFFAGLAFCFSPFRALHALEHLNVTTTQWMPFYVLALVRLHERKQMRDSLLLALFFFLTSLSCWYYGLFLASFTGLYLLWFLLKRDEEKRGRFLLLIGLASIICLVALSPVVYPMLKEVSVHDYATRPIEEAKEWSADLLAFFVPSPFHPLWGRAFEGAYERFSGNFVEQSRYLGYTLLFLAFFALVKVKEKGIKFWAFSSVAFLLLSLGPSLHIAGKDWNLPLPYGVLARIPPFSIIRAPSRWAIVSILCLSVLSGFSLKVLFQRLSQRKALALYGLLTGLLLLEFLTIPYPMKEASVPGFYEALSREAGDFALLEVPQQDSIRKYQFFQARHEKKLLSGFVARSPYGLLPFSGGEPSLLPFCDPELFVHAPKEDEIVEVIDPEGIRALLNFLEVKYVVLHEEFMCPVALDWAKKQAESLPGARLLSNGDGLWVYGLDEIASPPKPAYYLTRGWSVREQYRGQKFHWSLGRRSEVQVLLPEAGVDYLLTMTLMPISYKGLPQQKMKVSFNGQAIGEVSLEPGWHDYTLKVPASVVHEGINQMELTYAITAIPREFTHGELKDVRELAVALNTMKLKSL